MHTDKDWVAFLDEDEEDHLFWQHGFRSWADHLELHWFASVHAFLAASGLGRSNPVAVVMDGVVPLGEEQKWLSTLLLHPSCQQACLIMLSAQQEPQQHEVYLRLGATDHLLKPVNLEELKTSVLKVSGHVGAHQIP